MGFKIPFKRTPELNRRNITAYQRTELVLILEPMIREKAKENLKTSATGIYGGKPPLQNSAKAVDTREELAKAAVACTPARVADGLGK